MEERHHRFRRFSIVCSSFSLTFIAATGVKGKQQVSSSTSLVYLALPDGEDKKKQDLQEALTSPSRRAVEMFYHP